ncbi:hypothetical protein OJAV_G00183430 [Oryzias javanicus]|uniref:Uncharacterized protein n=1 Tax=Oryzias javanicus TaxID=123683 RepID=A0A3S2LTA9_ORYJA|nr:hypothetical protein OJAV_G00183430 [Oryzias javanicus]
MEEDIKDRTGCPQNVETLKLHSNKNLVQKLQTIKERQQSRALAFHPCSESEEHSKYHASRTPSALMEAVMQAVPVHQGKRATCAEAKCQLGKAEASSLYGGMNNGRKLVPGWTETRHSGTNGGK